MKKRKIILLCLIAILTVVYVLQLAFSGKTQVKDFYLEDNPDAIIITNSNKDTTTLVKDGDNWFINDKKFPADINSVNGILSDIKNIRSLGVVSHDSKDSRYGFDSASAIEVTLKKEGKELRTVKIGKVSATGQQSYILLDASKDVLLASGNLTSNVSKSVEDLRDKNVYSVNVSDILKVDVTNNKEKYQLAKTGEPAIWTLSSINNAATEVKVDTEKVNNWISNLTNLRVQSFADDNVSLPTEALANVSITTNQGKDIVVSVYTSTEEEKYLVKSSQIPYLFYVNSYTGEKYIKELKDLQ